MCFLLLKILHIKFAKQKYLQRKEQKNGIYTDVRKTYKHET